MATPRHPFVRFATPAMFAFAATLGLACAQSKPQSQAARPKASMDSAMLAQCYTPPETTATGHVGCVLRDQGSRFTRPGPKPQGTTPP